MPTALADAGAIAFSSTLREPLPLRFRERIAAMKYDARYRF